MRNARHREVARLLARRAQEQRERIVVVFGAGLHKYLIAGGAATYDCGQPSPLADWSALVKQVAKEVHIYHAEHKDPAADWESLVCGCASRELIQASQAETKLLRVVRKVLQGSHYDDKILRPLGTSIFERYRHIISLNIDSTLASALKAAGARATRSSPLSASEGKSWIAMHETLTNERGATSSVWYPHGCTEGGNEFVLGTRQYGNVISELDGEFGKYKEKLKSVRVPAHNAYTAESWNAVRSRTLEDSRHLNWVRLMMVCDLFFIGVGLDRAETDLWWALHQRQRNLARVPQSLRPQTFLMTTRESLSKSPHLHSEPAGVRPICFDRWEDAWSLILG